MFCLLTRLTVGGHARELGASGADLRSVDGDRVVQVGAVDVVRVRVVNVVRVRVSGHLSSGQSLRHVVHGGRRRARLLDLPEGIERVSKPRSRVIFFSCFFFVN